MAEPRLSTDEHAFDAMWDAATRRVPVTFAYARPGGETLQRRLEPWGIVSWRDRWYVGGFDVDRQAPRVFRLSRVIGEVETTGSPGDYEVPPGTDMRTVTRALFEPEPQRSATLLIREGRGQTLRRGALDVHAGADGFETVQVPFHSTRELAATVASYGTDVVALEPPDLRSAVVAHLRVAVAGSLDSIA
jgi:proteasome accessory factor B